MRGFLIFLFVFLASTGLVAFALSAIVHWERIKQVHYATVEFLAEAWPLLIIGFLFFMLGLVVFVRL